MDRDRGLPHVDYLLTLLRITRERLYGQTKVAVPAKILRELLSCAAKGIPFDEGYYRRTYADLSDAQESGHITDLYAHFIETGWLEGRFGAAPDVDEDFYLASYPDVRRAVESGRLLSAADHYIRIGAAEGRIPRASAVEGALRWRMEVAEK